MSALWLTYREGPGLGPLQHEVRKGDPHRLEADAGELTVHGSDPLGRVARQPECTMEPLGHLRGHE